MVAFEVGMSEYKPKPLRPPISGVLDKSEWYDVCRQFRPDATREEYEREWERFQAGEGGAPAEKEFAVSLSRWDTPVAPCRVIVANGAWTPEAKPEEVASIPLVRADVPVAGPKPAPQPYEHGALRQPLRKVAATKPLITPGPRKVKAAPQPKPPKSPKPAKVKRGHYKSPIEIGGVYGCLTVLAFREHRTSYGMIYNCRCACGKEWPVPAKRLNRARKEGIAASCGCKRQKPPKAVPHYTQGDIDVAVAKRILGIPAPQIAREMGISDYTVRTMLKRSDSPELAAAIAKGWTRHVVVDGIHYCKQGHAMTPENTAPRSARVGGYCLTCNRIRNRIKKTPHPRERKPLASAEQLASMVADYERGISVDSIAADRGLSRQQVYRRLKGAR